MEVSRSSRKKPNWKSIIAKLKKQKIEKSTELTSQTDVQEYDEFINEE